jgi:hypothetical protein
VRPAQQVIREQGKSVVFFVAENTEITPVADGLVQVVR